MIFITVLVALFYSMLIKNSLLSNASFFSPLILILILIIAAFDVLTINYFAWNTIRQAFFALHIMTMFTFVTKGHMKELNYSLAVAIRQTHLQMFRNKLLAYFRREYHLLLRVARYANEAIISNLLMTSFFSNMSLNVIIIGNLLFRTSLQPSEQVVMLTIVAIQIFLAFTSVFGLTGWSSSFGTSDRLLFKAQLVLSTSKKGSSNRLYQRSVLTMTKVKLASFYEQVLTTDEFRFTIGPFLKISQASVFQYSMIYSGVVIYVAKMVRRGRL